MSVAFGLLGPLEVRRADGTPVELGGRQQQLVLLCLLVADGHALRADALLDAVWGDGRPDSAMSTLHSYVSRLRGVLGDDGPRLLRRQGTGYVLDVTADQVDARRFERLAAQGSRLLADGDAAGAAAVLREADELWRGPLPDVGVGLVHSAFVRLEERRLAAQEDRFDAELRSGQSGAALTGLTAAVAEHPLRERLRGLLALALYRAGRQADALAAIEDGRRLLSDELGLDLSRGLRQLRGQILAQDPALDPPAAADRSAVSATSLAAAPGAAAGPAAGAQPAPPGNAPEPTAAPPAPLPLPRAPEDAEPDARRLIGRAAELRTLTVVLDDVLAGAGCRYLLVEGEPGMGKTRLAAELLELARARGARALSAATLEGGSGPSYWPWLQVLEMVERQGTGLADAGRVLRGLTEVAPGPSLAAAGDVVVDEVAALLRDLAEPAGLVVVLDDLQWADAGSLRVLTGLASRLPGSRVLLAATVRHLDGERDEAVVTSLSQMTRWPGTRRLTLGGLSRPESGRLLAAATGGPVPDDVVAVLHERSEGNPFFLGELARMLGEEGRLTAAQARGLGLPSGVRDVLALRLARLPEPTRRLLEVVAVLGREADTALLAVVAERPLEDCLDDLEPALLHRLLELSATRAAAVRFSHALVREAVLDGMSPLRRARLHLRAADGLLAEVGDTDDTAEIVAEHLWAAAAVGAAGRAAVALHRAAQVALKRQALVSAESLLTRAASLHQAAGTDAGLAELQVLRQLGFVRAALHGYAVNARSELVVRARELALTTDRLDILLDLIWVEWAGCDTNAEPVRALQLVEEAEALIAGVDDPLLEGAVLSIRGFSERYLGRMTDALAHTDRALRCFERAGDAQESGFYLNGYVTSLGFRQWAWALVHGLDREACERVYRAQDRGFGQIVMSLFSAAACLADGDDQGLALFAARMRQADPDMVLSFWSASALLYNGLALLHAGQVPAGLDLLEQGRAQMQQARGRTMLTGIFSAASQALVRAGERDLAQTWLARARAELAASSEQAYRPFLLLAEAVAAADAGDAGRAERWLDEATAVATAHGSLGIVARVARERAALGLGQRTA